MTRVDRAWFWLSGCASVLAASVAFAQAAPPLNPSPWFAIPPDAVYSTGDTWTYRGETWRLYGVQSCLRGTFFTNSHGVRVDCGEASLTMLASLVRDLAPVCYTAGWQPASRTRFLICIARPSKGAAAGSRIDLGTALISTGWAFAAVTPAGAPVHQPYIVAQAVAQKQRSGLWQFADLPDPNVIILRTIRSSGADSVAPPIAAPASDR